MDALQAAERNGEIMDNTVKNSTPLYGNVIIVNNFKKEDPNPKPKKNYNRTRTEACNGKVEPIRTDEDIKRICDYFYYNEQYRDWCMFVVGINTGLRISDIVRLRVSDVAAYDISKNEWVVKPIGAKFRIVPQKTEKKRKYVEININKAMADALTIYFRNTGCQGGCYYSYFIEKGWLFPSGKSSSVDSGRSKKNYKTSGDPIDEDSYGKIIRRCQKDLNLPYKIGTHTLRKTFGYRMFRQYQKSGGEGFALARLQQIFQHSSSKTTLAYIGISDDECRKMIESYYCGIDISSYK